MLQLRNDSLKRLLIIGEEPKEEKIEYCDFGIIYSTIDDKKAESNTTPSEAKAEKIDYKHITKEEFEKMLNAI